MQVQKYRIVYDTKGLWAPVTVCVPLYNYSSYIIETLSSLLAQTQSDISLVVVDDGSNDNSIEVTENWLKQFSGRFTRAVLAANLENAGLAITRNTATSISGSSYTFYLDADNLLYPRCIGRHLEALQRSSDAQAAFSLIEVFDGQSGIMGGEVFNRDRLKHGNYIDAMAMLDREFLIKLGGYHHIQYGWEDYDLWLRMCEAGAHAIQIPEILSRYRVHGSSMLRSLTNVNNNHVKLRNNMAGRHPWLELD